MAAGWPAAERGRRALARTSALIIAFVVVEADLLDTVALDCETVHRSAGAGGSTAGSGAGSGGPGGSAGRPTHPNGLASLSAAHARRIGKTILVTGHAAGVPRIVIRALRGGHTVGSTTAKVWSGRFRATLRAPRQVRVVISAGPAKRTIGVR